MTLARLVLLVVTSSGAADLEEAAHAAFRFTPQIEVLSRAETALHGLDRVFGRCGGNLGCIGDALERAEVDGAVLLERSGEPQLLSARIVHAGGGRSEPRTLVPLPSARKMFRDAVFGAVAEVLTEAGVPAVGAIAVDVEPADATIAIEGATPTVHDPARFFASAGSASVVSDRSGYVRAEALVKVRLFETARVRLTLEKEPSVLASPWLWTAVSVVAVGTGVGVWLGTRPRDIEICRGPSRMACGL